MRIAADVHAVADDGRGGCHALVELALGFDLGLIAGGVNYGDDTVEQRDDVEMSAGGDRGGVVAAGGPEALAFVGGVAGFRVEAGDQAAVANEENGAAVEH